MKKHSKNILLDRSLLTELILDKKRSSRYWEKLMTFISQNYERILYEPTHASALEIEMRSITEFSSKLVAIPNKIEVTPEETNFLELTLKTAKNNLVVLQAIQNYELYRKGPARPTEEILGYAFRLLLLARQHEADLAPWPTRTPILLSLFQEAGIECNSVMEESYVKLCQTLKGHFPFLPKAQYTSTPFDFGLLIINKNIIQTNPNTARTLLFITSDPTDQSRLRIGEESREIKEKLERARLRDMFVFEQRFSTRPEDLTQALLDLKPAIVHFSGHGTESGAICLEDRDGKTVPVDSNALAFLFKKFSKDIECVILNACFSEEQAKAIGQHIDYVIGMNAEIGDKAAIAFSVGFYQALGAGQSIKDSFEFGCVQIRIQGIQQYLIPVLYKKNDTIH